MVRVLIANTDRDWFDTLASQPGIDEVNFWQPSGTYDFRALQPGELFAFRLKAPINQIGGFGIFQHASRLPLSRAWEVFGIKNGVRSLEEMRSRVGRYRPAGERVDLDWPIGCRILVQPIFLPQIHWIPMPASWSANIVSFKAYEAADGEGRALWDRLVGSIDSSMDAAGVYETALPAPAARFGEPSLIRPRLGQGAFRVSVLDAYDRACAVSGGRVLPALEAAHIRPFADGGEHAVANGLLLRRDIHTVFDAGYVTVDPDLKFVVSDRLRTEFHNGEEYRRLHGMRLRLPASPLLRPSREALIWHNENCFRG
ncbi:MAG: HNH endonuclease [Caulobacteraceae bacterium]